MVKQFDKSIYNNEINKDLTSQGVTQDRYRHHAELDSVINVTRTEVTQNSNQDGVELIGSTEPPSTSKSSGGLKLSLKTKVTSLLITLGTIPVLLIGSIAYNLANQSITEEISQNNIARVVSLEDKLNGFIQERYADIRFLATLPVFTNSSQQQTSSLSERQALLLNRYQDIYQVYDSIAVLDLTGKVIAKSNQTPVDNPSSRSYFEQVINTKQPAISQPTQSDASGQLSLYLAAPVLDQNTKELVAVIQSRMPIQYLQDSINLMGRGREELYLINTSNGKIFLSNQSNIVNQPLTKVFPDAKELLTADKPNTLVTSDQVKKHQDLLAYTPFSKNNDLSKINDLPDLPWVAVMATPDAIAFLPQRQLLLTLTLGTSLTTLLVAAVAVYLANRLTSPLLAATKAVKALGEGELDTRLELLGTDELGVLGSNINRMASQLQTLVANQQASLDKARLFADVVTHAAKPDEKAHAFDLVVNAAKEKLAADRVVIYYFDPGYRGTIVAEAVDSHWPKAIAQEITDACIPRKLLEAYRKGRVVPTSDVQAVKYASGHMQLLNRLQVKANLVVPIVGVDNLIGLLVAHQCSRTRVWRTDEIDFLQELATHLGLALSSASLATLKTAEADRAGQVIEITSGIRQSFTVEEIYQSAISGIREALKTDRVLVYLFDENWQGTIVAESVGHGWPKSLGAEIADPCFAHQYVEKYQQGRVTALDNIYQAGLSDCYFGQLEPFKVKANLVAPILGEEKLLGLLVAHQCSGTRHWQESDINFFRQMSIQLGFALEQAKLVDQLKQARTAAEVVSQEQQQQREALQLQLLELVNKVEGAAQGDLTVRAEILSGEIGTVADFFNAVIESLRGIVTQVKTAATQVNQSVGDNAGAIHQLSEAALQQTQEITHTLDSVAQMTSSIQEVAFNARQAAAVAHTAANTAQSGTHAIERSVASIIILRDTIAETAKKVKRLGESSQQISQVVAFINQIALQTNLLSINAGIEAARAGEDGQGFAVVAEEVGELAARAATATKEIEQIVDNIQQGTSEVVEAMELGTTQVVEGTYLVQEAKDSFRQILNVSTQIDQFIQSISQATVSQAETSSAVTNVMKDIAQISERTYQSTEHISHSLQDTVSIAEELQTSVGKFKVAQNYD
ncbi:MULTISPECIES: methyl-accepting chemotaxis protein [Moorena]|uniref:Methyl-accepting chemotaxis protein n=1 Tax=Moorena producens 3L TaxID=489825 RepID=F4XN10_9CYAN|nr:MULTISPECIES: methyl-accepting chemotaxis protein [Moorena]EGJ34069.1 methyl-accepting chemotaxis protein [Moorena producens 3L]NEP32715.1 GAF domain-containing protein [Moorena sp. SIO3B2]NEP65545.1 GAF domain-containing protein [Moorena sp. SIO3A5]OLT65049.1 chemotaxis protein CheD [Moorena producens 3L]